MQIPQIRNCNWKFKFQCPLRWEGLRTTDDPNVRTCESCLRSVYLCENEEEVAQRSAAGQCVALGFERNEDGEMLMGEIVET